MPRAGLSPIRIVEEAEVLADEIGLARLSLAGLAERLGVRVPSLYKHIQGADSLHRLLAVRAKNELAAVLGDALGGADASAPGATDGRDTAIAAVAWAYRSWAKGHPGRYSATLRAPDPDDPDDLDASTRAAQVIFGALTPWALAGDNAVNATRALRAALHGFVALEAAGGFGLPVDVDASFDSLVLGLCRMLADWPRDAEEVRSVDTRHQGH